MIADLRALLAVATGGDRRIAWRLALLILGSIGSDFVIMYSLLMGLAHRRAGEAYGPEVRLFLVAVAVFYVVSLAVNRELNLRFTGAARASIGRITRRLPRLPVLDYEALGRGTLVTRILGDGNQVASCRRVVFGVLSGGLRLLLGSLLAIAVSPGASTVAFAGLVLISIVVIGQLGALQAGFRAVAPDDARMYELLRGQLRGGIALKVHRPRSRELGRVFEAVSERVRALRVAVFSGFYERQFAGDAVIYGLLGVTTFAVPLVVGITSEDVRELNMITLWLVLGAVKLVSGLPRLASTGTALARLQDLEARLDEAKLEAPVREDQLDGGGFAGFRRIAIEGLEFRYPVTAGRPVFPLGPVDLQLERGELVFITGRNGSGKSTFARLLAGLHRPRLGTIAVDGVVGRRPQPRRLPGPLRHDLRRALHLRADPRPRRGRRGARAGAARGVRHRRPDRHRRRPGERPGAVDGPAQAPGDGARAARRQADPYPRRVGRGSRSRVSSDLLRHPAAAAAR
jgi:putative ATP-binding cassette transporter